MRKSGSKKKKTGIDVMALLAAIFITAFIIFIARGGFGALSKILMSFRQQQSISLFLYF